MVECQTLDVEAGIQGEVLAWAFKTDLPTKTIVMVSCIRYYKDFDGRNFQWSIFEDRVFCEPIDDDLNGAEGEIDLVSSEADAIQRVLAIHAEEWRGIRSIKDDALHLRCHLVPYQRERLDDYGENNRQLIGPEVYQSGEGFFVTKELKLRFPSNEFQCTTSCRS